MRCRRLPLLLISIIVARKITMEAPDTMVSIALLNSL
jgi:hypothetical protein